MSNQFEFSAFTPISLAQLAWLIEQFPFTRRISAIHLHHSGRPNHRQYQGRETILEIAHQHVERYGLSTIAQHLTVAPDGVIWLGRNWDLPPASAAGHNGSTISGPLMITLLGDFDRGQDVLTFDGEAPLTGQADDQAHRQGNTALRLIALLQQHFNLDVENLRFHRDMSQVTSPGSSIDYGQFVRELRKTRKLLSKAEKEGQGYQPANADRQSLRLLLDAFSKSRPNRMDGPDAEVHPLGTGSRDYNRFVGSTTASSANADRGLFGPEITPAMLDELAPHVINLEMGHFSQDGVMQTDASAVDAIFEDHLVRAFENRVRDQPLRIVFYAHGGLVGEKEALEQAYQHVNWWRRNNVYPIYFIWETGLWPMFWQSLRGTRDRALTREAFTDGFVEELARGLGGPRVWQAIKSSAATATNDPTGAAHYTIRKLQEFLDGRSNDVELHAVGHSAGAIFHSFFVPAIVKPKIATFRTVQLLAPAITVEDFKARMAEYMGNGIDHLPIFTMRKELERKDPVASPWYNRSILYLVSHAMEPTRNTAVLGLEESLRADQKLKAHFGLQGRIAPHGEVIWTTTRLDSGRSASGAASHVHFTCDPATMNSVLRRVINADDNDPITGYPATAACGGRSLTRAVELSPILERLVEEGLLNPTALINRAPDATPMFPDSGSGRNGAAFLASGGRRRALCIGIDNYAVSPLTGCVADARLWADTLQSLGFASPVMLLNSGATRSAIIDALTDLLTTSRAGDLVVIQFAGHGIALPDLNGDEASEDSNKDEAFCPVDFDRGAYLIDDDLAAIFAQTPDGVTVTCFFDCCYSGTITRLAVGASTADLALGERERYLLATPERIHAHRRYRHDMGYQPPARSRGPATMNEVVFSACLSTEVALESNGHGHFTLRATEQLRAGINGVTNEQFQRNVVDAFGAARRQNPFLDCAPAARNRFVLQPIEQMVPGGGLQLPVSMPFSTAGGHNGRPHDTLHSNATITELLHKVVMLLEDQVNAGS